MSNQPLVNTSAERIDIWLAFYDQSFDTSLLSQMRAILSSSERYQESCFHFARDQRRFVITRAMVRTVLSRYASTPPSNWEFTRNEFGRPEIANASCESLGLRFNVSHTKGLIVVAVSHFRELGVDVEHLENREGLAGLAEQFFSPIEAADLSRTPSASRHERFFEYWTFKEAYIKARGMGLSIPLDQFSFHFPDVAAVRMSADPRLGDDASRWCFWQVRPTPDHMLAICSERLNGKHATLTFRKMTPLVSDEPFPAQTSRTNCLDS